MITCIVQMNDYKLLQGSNLIATAVMQGTHHILNIAIAPFPGKHFPCKMNRK